MKQYVVIKCRKCRTKLLDSETSGLVTGHDSKLDRETFLRSTCEEKCWNFVDSFYVEEPGLPDWILASINQGDWEKGKLKCPSCSGRVGSFDYVSGRKCQCGRNLLPPVHIIKSKIDISWEEMETST